MRDELRLEQHVAFLKEEKEEKEERSQREGSSEQTDEKQRSRETNSRAPQRNNSRAGKERERTDESSATRIWGTSDQGREEGGGERGRRARGLTIPALRKKGEKKSENEEMISSSSIRRSVLSDQSSTYQLQSTEERRPNEVSARETDSGCLLEDSPGEASSPSARSLVVLGRRLNIYWLGGRLRLVAIAKNETRRT